MVGIHIRLPRELKERVERMAKADRRSIAAQVQVLIERALGVDEKQDQPN